MDRKPYNGFDPRYFWAPYTSSTWYPVSGGGWSRQVSFPSGTFYIPDPGLGSIYTTPAATFTRQQGNMYEGNVGSASPTTAFQAYPDSQASPPVSQAEAANADADADANTDAKTDADANVDVDLAAAGTIVAGHGHGHGHGRGHGRGQFPDPPRLPAERALEQLLRELDDAFQFCDGCVRQHEEDIEKVAKYLDEECRNGLWRSLLESKFKDSERDRHLFINLPADMQWYLQQTVEAAAADLSAHADDGEARTKCENVVHRVRILAIRVEKAIKHAQNALGDLAECKHMMDEVTVIKAECENVIRGEQL